MNIKMIYPTEHGVMVEVISKEDAIRNQHERAKGCNYTYDSDEDALQDLLRCPITETTNDPIGKNLLISRIG